jgi:hypothetical protein
MHVSSYWCVQHCVIGALMLEQDLPVTILLNFCDHNCSTQCQNKRHYNSPKERIPTDSRQLGNPMVGGENFQKDVERHLLRSEMSLIHMMSCQKQIEQVRHLVLMMSSLCPLKHRLEIIILRPLSNLLGYSMYR